jgi:uncharacterized membrane protein YhaH (DUF805 family)
MLDDKFFLDLFIKPTFKGRVTEGQYILGAFFTSIIGELIYSILINPIFPVFNELGLLGILLYYSLYIYIIYINITLMIRRLHDHGKNELFLLWLLLPFIGWFVVGLHLLSSGNKETNKYGEPFKKRS